MRCHCPPLQNKFFEQLQKVKIVGKRLCYAKKLNNHAVSLTPLAKYDTACTIDERATLAAFK
jgi:hypothetical protein